MAKIFIDNQEHVVNGSKNLLEVILTLGYDLPYFCWHPALGSVGACRQCAVIKYKDENDKAGKLVMSCMEPVTENLRISLKATDAVDFRKGIIEWLMTNHPHDCPVCDEGGECHLQDMTLMTGHNYRRFNHKKRTHTNQYLGPFLNHEMNRCIQCYRCVRFYRDYAGGRDLDVFAAHDHIYFGRHKDGVFENEFSGNLIEVCPTGVFTDKTLKKHYTRKWDLTSAPSVCPHCSVGCNIIAGERYGSLRRILTRYNGEVNGYFICDRGRFGYEFVNDITRIKYGRLKNRNTLTKEETIKRAKEFLTGKIAGIGSPRASLESNFALKKLVSSNNFYAGESKNNFSLIKEIINNLKKSPVKTATLREIEKCDAVFILGEDITNTAPMIALAVRQASKKQPLEKALSLNIPDWNDDAVRTIVKETHGPVYMAVPYPVKLGDISSGTIIDHPDKIAKFGLALANSINSKFSSSGIQEKSYSLLIKNIADELQKAKKPLIISGIGCRNKPVIQAAFNVANALYQVNKNTRLSFVVPESNSMGLAMMEDKDFDDLFISKEKYDTLIILENDLFRRKNESDLKNLFEIAENIIVLDHLENRTTDQADLVIPVGTYAESDGTFVNNEGRAQRFYQVFIPKDCDIQESWRWLEIISGCENQIKNFDDLVHELSASHPQFKGIEKLAPPASFRKAGQKIPRQPAAYSGRTAINAHKNIHEEQPPDDPDSPLTYSMEGFRGKPPSSVIPYFWSPGWNSAQAINKYQIEIGGALHDGDPGIRLIEPSLSAMPEIFNPSGFTKSENEIKAVPVHYIFGSEELSAYSSSIRELSPKTPSGIINPEMSLKLNVKEGDALIIKTPDEEYSLSVKILRNMPDGLIGIPEGLQNFYFDFGKPVQEIKKKNNE